MPIYEYKCTSCGHTADRISRYEDRKTPQQCPICFNGELEFVDKIHSGSFTLKGNDWYKPGHS